MKSYIVVQKKILVITYSLWKNGQEYDEKYRNNYKKTQENEFSTEEMAIVGEL